MSDPREILFKAAISHDPPLLTDDPIVNHKVDVYLADASVPFNLEKYLKEIAAWKLTGGYLLSYTQV